MHPLQVPDIGPTDYPLLAERSPVSSLAGKWTPVASFETSTALPLYATSSALLSGRAALWQRLASSRLSPPRSRGHLMSDPRPFGSTRFRHATLGKTRTDSGNCRQRRGTGRHSRAAHQVPIGMRRLPLAHPRRVHQSINHRYLLPRPTQTFGQRAVSRLPHHLRRSRTRPAEQYSMEDQPPPTRGIYHLHQHP